jgi:microcystin-dependent protein
VRLFAGTFAPFGWLFCQGQILSITNNEALFSILGTLYGGNGVTNFALPDFRMRIPVDSGQAPGLSPWDVGEMLGVTQVTFATTEIPAHTHSLPPPYGVSGSTGGSQPRENWKPSLGFTCLINIEGLYPLATQTVFEPFLGQMPLFAGNYAGNGAAIASGQLLPISQNTALFSLLGTNYGGDGQITFSLPDLRGRTPMGIGQGAGLTTRSLGQKQGQEIVTMTAPQLPAHDHIVSFAPPFGYVTGTTGSNQPQNLVQPSIALQFLIATNGEVPSITVTATNKMIGEIQLYAGTNVPGGWAPCNGQLLQVSAYPALFSVISNSFGGDGTTTFALPDLSGRVSVGTTNEQPGAKYGAEQAAMTLAQMPAHTHLVPALDYDRWATYFGLSGVNAAFDADPDGDGVKNGFEWATASNPTNAASVNRLQITSASDTLQIQFNRNTNATDVSFLLQRTTNLFNPNAWTAIVTNIAGAWQSPTGIVETGINPVNVSVSVVPTNPPAADYRLKIEWP